jgi:hypothetical protein
VSRTSACSNNVCTFSDSNSSLTSYTVATPSYFPLLYTWPGDIVLGATADSNNLSTAAVAYTDEINSDIVAEQGPLAPAVIGERCITSNAYGPNSVWMSCYSAMGPSQSFPQGSLLLAVKPIFDGGTSLNLKGRINFSTLGTGPGHIITLFDSNFAKTIATGNNRPTNDLNDAFIGYDTSNSQANGSDVGISFGAPGSISHYIANVGDGTNWKERLTANSKTFNVNTTVNGNLTVTGTCTGCGGSSSSSPLTTKGDLFGFSTANTRLPVGINGQVLTADSTQITGLRWANSSLTPPGTAQQIPFNDNGSWGTYAGFTFDKSTGNLNVPGQILVTGPWTIEGNGADQAIAGAGKSKVFFAASGQLSVSENAGAVTEIAKVDSPISGFSGSATAAQMPDLSATYQTVSAMSKYMSPVLDWGHGFTTAGGQTVGFNSTTNHANLFGIYIDRPVTCTGITVYVVTPDNSANTYDVGLYYGVSGSLNNLIAHTGAVAGSTYFATGSSYTTVPFGATVTLYPGRYYLAMYANQASAPLTLAGNTAADWEFYHLNGFSMTASSGGLPPTLTGPADGTTSTATPHFLLK